MMWAISVKFLRGVCVATDTGQWDEAEWPPHPARLFMAMAAAYFETRSPIVGQSADVRRAALEWLEQQPAPRVFASEAETRTPVTVYVPVNDSTKTDQLFASARNRQPRHFPTSVPHRDELHYVFDGELQPEIASGLQSVTEEIVRIGHSSSLAQVWIETKFRLPNDPSDVDALIEWKPTVAGQPASDQLRVFTSGMLDSLEANFNLDAIEEYTKLENAISERKGKEKSNLRAELSVRYPQGMPPSLRPPPANTIGYSKQASSWNLPDLTCFDSELMILVFHDAPTIPLESTLQLAGAIRKRIHDAYPNRTSPEWLGGHQADGSPSTKPHMAIVPLPFIDHKHADGHVMGLALAFPRGISKRERAMTLRQLFVRSENVDDWMVELHLHDFRRLTGNRDPECNVTLVREQRLSPPRTLTAGTWTSASTVWETVTPIALDRFPKRDRDTEREAWNEEVAETIANSCRNIGLPSPIAIGVHYNSFITGVPRARPQGGGFPPIQSRQGKASRFQVHARIEFDVPVVGPVILGAGRFVGYGFCRPNLLRCRAIRTGDR